MLLKAATVTFSDDDFAPEGASTNNGLSQVWTGYGDDGYDLIQLESGFGPDGTDMIDLNTDEPKKTNNVDINGSQSAQSEYTSEETTVENGIDVESVDLADMEKESIDEFFDCK
jgi:hypothetical protein